MPGARGPPLGGQGGTSRDILRVRFSPQPARNSLGWPPGSRQLRVRGAVVWRTESLGRMAGKEFKDSKREGAVL